MLIVLRNPRCRLWFSDSFESILVIRSTGKTHPPPCIFCVCVYVCVCLALTAAATPVCALLP